jgi:flagellar biosynthesis/type III secretory pathway protein FliH
VVVAATAAVKNEIARTKQKKLQSGYDRGHDRGYDPAYQVL